MKIKKAKNTDAKALTELTIRSKAYWDYGNQQIEAWRDELTITPKYFEENHLYKLVDTKKIIGFYAYQSLTTATVKLNFLFIEPEFIGKGHGKVLMMDFLRRMEISKYKKVTLDADPNAEVFYKKMGFQTTGQVKSTIKDRFLPIMEREV